MTTSPIPPLPAVFGALTAVQSELDGIAKDRRVTEGPARFQFRGVDDVMNALHPALVKHGLIVLPQAQERLAETRATRNGSTMNVVHLRVRFTFAAPDGSMVHAEAWGEGQDSGDKATGKAHSMAYKSAMLQVFSIPTEPGSSVDDADTDQGTEAAPETDAQRALRERRRAEAGHGRPYVDPELAAQQERSRQDAQASQDGSSGPPSAPAHLKRFDIAWDALTPDQRQWVVDNRPWTVHPNTFTVAQVAQAVEWMAANVPPPVTVPA